MSDKEQGSTKWNPIISRALKAANDMGHSMGTFEKPGGRLLAYRCGTKEARGVL